VFDGRQDRLPPRIDNMANKLSNLCLRLNIIYIWRHTNPQSLVYTWSNRVGTDLSNRGLIFGSFHIKERVEFVTIEPSVLIDHKGISIKINVAISQSRVKRGYWKLNNSLLKHKDLCDQIKNLIIKHWQQASLIQTYGTLWEQTKFEIRKFTIMNGKSVKKRKKKMKTQYLMKLYPLLVKIT